MADGGAGVKIALKIYFPGFNTTKAFMFDTALSIAELVQDIQDRSLFLAGQKDLELYLPPDEGRPHGRYARPSEVLGDMGLQAMEILELRTPDQRRDVQAEKKQREGRPQSLHLVTSLRDVSISVPHTTHTFSDVATLQEHGAKPETQFMIQLSLGSDKWMVSRSESNIRSLCETLSQSFGDEKLPKCPAQLSKQSLLKLFKKFLSKPVLIMSPEFRQFLAVDLQHGADLSNLPSEKGVSFAAEIARSMSSGSGADLRVPNVDIAVNIPREEVVEGSSALLYLIELKSSGTSQTATWTVVRSYSDFNEMHLLIKKSYGDVLSLQLPPEGKNITHSPALMKMQRTNLARYLQKVIDIEGLRSFGPVYEFFDLESLVGLEEGEEMGAKPEAHPAEQPAAPMQALASVATQAAVAGFGGYAAAAPSGAADAPTSTPAAAAPSSPTVEPAKPAVRVPLPAKIDDIPLENDVLGLFEIKCSPGKLDPASSDVVFEMEISDDATGWNCSHTYSEFELLHVTMLQYFALIPDLPPITDFSEASLRRLGDDLTIFLACLLRRENSDQCAPFLTFLAIQYEEEVSDDEGAAEEAGVVSDAGPTPEATEVQIIPDSAPAVDAVAVQQRVEVEVGVPEPVKPPVERIVEPIAAPPDASPAADAPPDGGEPVSEVAAIEKSAVKEPPPQEGAHDAAVLEPSVDTVAATENAVEKEGSPDALSAETPSAKAVPAEADVSYSLPVAGAHGDDSVAAATTVSSGGPKPITPVVESQPPAVSTPPRVPPARPVVPRPEVPSAPRPEIPSSPRPEIPSSPRPEIPSAPRPEIPSAPRPGPAPATPKPAISASVDAASPPLVAASPVPVAPSLRGLDSRSVLPDDSLLKCTLSLIESSHTSRPRFIFECNRLFRSLFSQAMFATPLTKSVGREGSEMVRLGRKVCCVLMVPVATIMESAWRSVSFDGVVGFVNYDRGIVTFFGLPEDLDSYHVLLSCPTTPNAAAVAKTVDALLARGAGLDRLTYVTAYIAAAALLVLKDTLPGLRTLCARLENDPASIPRLHEKYYDAKFSQ